MPIDLWGRRARMAAWWIRRNPLYLLSATAMAIGARLYLVTPDAPAGEIGLILLTLGVLQLYEIAVSAVLLTLHRFRRSPEDLPSLLLVAGLFWTGPLAATVEMTARHGGVGLGFAAAAVIVALCEMAAIQRELGLRFSRWGQALSGGCLLLIALAPMRLRAAFDAGQADEAALYAAWWVLASVALLALGTLRRGGRGKPFEATNAEAWEWTETAFVGVVLAAAATHLYGMNYAFFAHARPFYAAPVLVVVAVIGIELFRGPARKWMAIVTVSVLPLVSVALSVDSFDRHFGVDLPRLVRDPLITSLVLAGLAWWIAAQRGLGWWFVHAGSAAVAFAAWRIVHPLLAADTLFVRAPAPLRVDFVLGAGAASLALYATAAYFAISAWLRRSRSECVAALFAHLAGLSLLVWRRTPADQMIIALAIGWTWLIAGCIWRRGFDLRFATWPLALLMTTTLAADFDTAIYWPARAHALVLPAVLLIGGRRTRHKHLRIAGGTCGAIALTFLLGRGVSTGPNVVAALSVLGAFVLLAAGAALSWHKRRLLPVQTYAAPPPFKGGS